MNIQAIAPEIILFTGACILLILSLFRLPKRHILLSCFSISIPITSLIVLFQSCNKVTQIGELFLQDHFAFYCRALLIVIGMLSVLSSMEMFSKRSKRQGEFTTLLLFSVGGLMLLTQATHLLSLYLAIEISSIPLYMIAGLKTNDPKSKEAIVKYFLLGAFTSAVMIYGTSLIFSATDQLSFYQLAHIVRKEPLVILGSIMILSNLLFKVAAFPFHFWAPDVYEGSLPVSTAFISAGPKIGAMVAISRFVYMGTGFPLKPILGSIILVLAILSMFVGNLSAIWQKEVKRMMAYSSIAQVGNMLLAVYVISMNNVFTKDLAFKGLLFYITSYSLANMGIFSILCLVDIIKKDTTLAHFKGLAKEYPWLAFPMTILLLSLLGIPIFSGFFSKLIIFSSLAQASKYWLLIIAVLNAVISAFYYLQVVKFMFIPSEEPTESREKIERNPAFVTCLISAFLVSTIGLIPLFYRLLDWAKP